MRYDTKNNGACRQGTVSRACAEGKTPCAIPDEHLVALFVGNRDEDAFGELVNRYADRIYRIALRITRDPSEAEDVLQDVFVILTSKAGTFRMESRFSTWLYRVALNSSYMRIRTKKKITTNESSLDGYAPYDESGFLRDVADRDFSGRPDSELMSREALDMIRDSINELPEQYKDVFHLRHEEGLSDLEAAEVLGISVSAAKSRIHRARLFLRDRLADYFFETGR
ncbi:MAG: sigma-70 family RNA polymerase sigma factor [Candidatus Dadabacteria bacterium]|nr:sigma-70 family RNA polymerase sigma factor [Candidatus Dadabacteria bacterium]